MQEKKEWEAKLNQFWQQTVNMREGWNLKQSLSQHDYSWNTCSSAWFLSHWGRLTWAHAICMES